jgi:hypothetical protein
MQSSIGLVVRPAGIFTLDKDFCRIARRTRFPLHFSASAI